MGNHRFPYIWNLADARFTKDRGTVFSCFACGGGSTMGYKLAGFDVIGCNEIDPRMMEAYQRNHAPRFPYLEPIQEFRHRDYLPSELYDLDILDGSPPCSSFSMAGVNCGREAGWGKKKKFREGQAEQVLDTLFFDFIAVADRLKPKIVIAENVKGLLLGEARNYVTRIYHEFEAAGYHCQHFVLDAQTMGVPQRRERVFFVCLRKDLIEYVPHNSNLFGECAPVLKLDFKESPILFGEVIDRQRERERPQEHEQYGREIKSPKMRKYWEARQPQDDNFGDVTTRLFGRKSAFNNKFVHSDKICGTLTGKEDSIVLYDEPRYLSRNEVCRITTFPMDYQFADNKPHYIGGMSVPPVMMANIASEVWTQWLSKIQNM